MRIAFLLVLLAGGIYYSYVAFVDLNFLTRSGRLGPGFFPRLIGVMMILFTLWTLADALRAGGQEEEPGWWRDILIVMALALCYGVLLRLFGGFVATFAFLAVALSILNRGRHVQNATISVLVPSGVYLLFDQLLNANMPPALIELPFF
jgi:hypothetical protein